MTRLLGIDLGERRVGLAVAEAEGDLARPLRTVPRGRTVDADIATLAGVVAAERIDALVVGLPLEASGEAGTMAGTTREWAAAVAAALGLPCRLQDERLSSHRAEERIGPMKRGRSGGPPTRAQREAWRARVDREAAAIILQDHLDGQPAVPYSGPATRETMETDR